MTFYIYTNARPRTPYPHNWALHATKDTIEEAETVALMLLGKRSFHDIYSEPGHGLKRAFFAKTPGGKWKAMIETRDIHAPVPLDTPTKPKRNPFYVDAIAWMVQNDDCFWMRDYPKMGLSVTASMIMDVFKVDEAEMIADIKKLLTAAEHPVMKEIA